MLTQKRHPNLTEDQLIIIKNNLVADKHVKLSIEDLAATLDKSVSTIRSILAKIRKNPNFTTYKFRENYFECIDHQEKAYWLGFLCADGCIASDRDRLHVTLSDKDISHLDKFRIAIDYPKTIRQYDYKDPKHELIRHKCSIAIGSKKLVTDLINNGCGRQKTQTLCFPNHLTYDMIRHWIRGFVDGDGSFFYSYNHLRFNVCGTFDVINGINTYLNLNNNIMKDKRSPLLYYITVQNAQKMPKLVHTLYDDATVFLERKREKLNPILGPVNAY